MTDDPLDKADQLLAAGHIGAAVDIVEHAALSSAAAMFRLATWHLVGDPLPRDLPRARLLLRQSTDAGNADAAMMEVALTANGTGAPPDWASARRLLEEAAARDIEIAQKHVNLLSGMDIDAQGYPRRLPPPEKLSDTPLVHSWRNVLTADECAHLATSVLDLLGPSMVVDPRTGQQIAHPVRKSSAAVIGPTRETLPIQAIQRRLSAMTGTSVSAGEPLAILHYAPGQEYLPHVDTLPHEPNQRVMTALIYLNKGYLGGETHFPGIGLTMAGKAGDVLVFTNTQEDGSPDARSRHAGLPVRNGTKWLATRWIRNQPLDIWASRG